MPFSRNINTYTDIEAVLQAARKSGVNRCTYTLETRGLAVNWRARAYAYRALLRDAAHERLSIPGYQPTTPWDDMILELAPGSRQVVIRFGVEVSGQLSVNGQPVTIAPVTMPEPVAAVVMEQLEAQTEDELEREARELLARLGADE